MRDGFLADEARSAITGPQRLVKPVTIPRGFPAWDQGSVTAAREGGV